MSNAIQKHGGSLALRARGWATLSDADLKRRAATAANERHPHELWSLVEAHMATKTRAGTRTSKHTLRNYKRGVLDLLDAWQGENLLRPTRNAADLYVATLADRKHANGEPVYKPGTIRLKIAAARALYRALRWAGATTLRPFEDVTLPNDPTAAWDKRQPYTHEEVEAMLRKANTTDTAIILLGAHAGLRVSEIVALEWRDVDFDAGNVKVRVGKGGKEGTVPLSGSTIRALQALRAEAPQSDRVFPFSTTQRAYDRVRRVAYRALLGKGKGVHALRHYCGTRTADEQGLEAAQQLLRHSNLSTTQTYAKWRDRIKIKEMVEQW